jgi:pimeloyl-ACP methyl ester carboxylesterase
VFARVLRRPERVADLARAVNPASTQPDALMARVHTNDLGIAMQIARPFSSGECLLRQALAITSVFGEGGAAIDLDRKLQVPTLAIVGGSDDVVDNAVTERLVRDQEHARLWSEPEGDHYMVSNRPRVIARAVGSFLRQEP